MTAQDAQPAVKMPTDIRFVLRNKQIRDKFESFLIDRIAVESLKFLDDVKMYEHVEKPEWRARAGSTLISKFVVPNSQYEINISEEVRKTLLSTKVFERDTFKAAKDSVIDLLQENFFRSFIEYLKDPSSSTMKHRQRDSIHECYRKEPYFDRRRPSVDGNTRNSTRFSHRVRSESKKSNEDI
mmetsp:Transcript_8764/g.11456  ORF Transcript_8764/g.11456 Transcript_8764/m.11456 type:complete len:183 (-) Transcript_8764:286-834(-)